MRQRYAIARDAEVGARHAVPTPRPPRGAPRLLGIATIVCLLAAGTGLPTPATPVASANAPCTVTPRSAAEITALLANANIATPAPTTDGQTLPEGIPVSSETAAAIDSVVRTWLACQNAGAPLRAWALFSDGYLYRLLIRQGVPADIASAPSTPESDADGGAMLLEIRDARELPDGRLGATVVIAYPAVPMPKTFFFTFIEVDGRLFIDGVLGEISFAVP